MRWGCGCGSFRAGVRVISGFSRLLRAAVWPPGERGSTAVIISRPCWYSLGSGATLRTCRRRFRGQPEVMQRFLTDSPWDDEVSYRTAAGVPGNPDWSIRKAVWVLDGSDFPKQGRKSVGVARQYCGRLGKVANCQAGMFLAYVSPLGRALVDKGLYLPESWTSDKDRCEAAGVPEDRQGYRSKTELALEMVGRVTGAGPPEGWMGRRRTTPSGCRRPSGRAWRPQGMWYVLDVPVRLYGVAAWSLLGPVRSIRDSGVPAKPRLRGRSAPDHRAAQRRVAGGGLA